MICIVLKGIFSALLNICFCYISRAVCFFFLKVVDRKIFKNHWI